jgi:gliding motility-associated-like protein
VVGGNYDAATMSPGVYTYTIAAVAPCVGSSATVTVTEENPANAGISSSIDACPGGQSIDLFNQLTGAPQAGGSWTRPNGAPFNGIFNPALDPGGLYTYALAGTACPSVSSSVTVNLLQGPNAGSSASISVCSNQSPFALLSQLGGTPDAGGSWSDAQGQLVSGTFNPASDAGGSFTYMVSGSSACPAATSVLSIAVSAAPLAGISGSITSCASGAALSLFDGLSGTLDADGTWTGPDGSVHASSLSPASDASGVYTYTVAGIAPCPVASSTVLVTLLPVPDAGSDGQLTLCSDGPVASLFQALGGTPQPSGTWTGPDGAAHNAAFAPGVDAPGTYTYTVAGTAPCTADAAVVVVGVSTAGHAGVDGAVALCASDAPVDLASFLGGQPDAGGNWSGPSGSVSNGWFDPAVDVPGTYSYTIVPASPCPAVSATVGVDVILPPVAEFSMQVSQGCSPVQVLFSHAYQGPGSCTWILGDGTEISDCGPVMHAYTVPGIYDVSLIIDAGNGCGADTVTVPHAVQAAERPAADFEQLPEQASTQAPTAFFNNLSEGASAYTWDIDGTSVSALEDLLWTFPSQLGASYTVCLIAWASPACADTACRVIDLADGMQVHVPNAFTPNGDQRNDGFLPVVSGADESQFLFEVFDRWGLRVFRSEKPGEAWNGLRPDGTEAPQDVYVWKLRLKDAYTRERVERMGHVTLLR